jgi:hypothetical protein
MQNCTVIMRHSVEDMLARQLVSRRLVILLSYLALMTASRGFDWVNITCLLVSSFNLSVRGVSSFIQSKVRNRIDFSGAALTISNPGYL